MAEPKLSKVEGIKAESRRLRGTISHELQQPTALFGEADHQLLKFHGIYQGYDRDSATELKQQGLDKRHEFMARIKAPGGVMNAEQYLAVDRLAQAHSGGKLRITTRQGLQFHGVLKGDLWSLIHGVNQALLSTFAACGDVVRQVTATAAPIEDELHRRLRRDATYLSRSLAPQTRAYHEIWVDGEDVATAQADEPAVDPLYGATMLPRKFKIGLAAPEDNGIDVLTNDLGLIAITEQGRVVGYNLAVGGGLGMTHNKPHTYPRLASELAFVEPDDLLAAVKAVIGIHRDFGDRVDRKHARLKYVVDAFGLERIKAELDQRLGKVLEGPRRHAPFAVKDHTGWHEQGDGNWYFGLTVPSGRIEDGPHGRFATAFRRIFSTLKVRPVFTANQDIFFADVMAFDKPLIETILEEEAIPLPASLTPLRRSAIACPALPSCGLALTEAERVLDDIVSNIEVVLARHGLSNERISLRVTGCPNGCARPYVGDIGLVGRVPGYYAIFLGGDFEGTRLNERIYERVPMDEIGATLEPVIALFAAERAAGEGFGDFCRRFGADRLLSLVATAEAAE